MQWPGVLALGWRVRVNGPCTSLAHHAALYSCDMAADRFNRNRSWDHLQTKYVGTGHADMTKFEWAVNHHRDTMASHIGHHDFLSFAAVCENEATERARLTMLEKMVQPCGPPPKKEG